MANEPEIYDQDRGCGTHEDAETGEDGDEGCGSGEESPWLGEDPEDGEDDCSAALGEVFGTEHCDVHS